MPFIVPINIGGQTGVIGSIVPVNETFSDDGVLIDPDVSWLYWSCRLEVIQDDRIAVGVPLAGQVYSKDGGSADVLGAVADVRDNTNPPGATTVASVPNVLQRVSGPTFVVRLVGQAIRVGYPVAPPALVTYGGQSVTQARRRLTPLSAGNIGGLPLYGLGWEIDYVLASAPDQIETPVDVMGNVEAG